MDCISKRRDPFPLHTVIKINHHHMYHIINMYDGDETLKQLMKEVVDHLRNLTSMSEMYMAMLAIILIFSLSEVPMDPDKFPDDLLDECDEVLSKERDFQEMINKSQNYIASNSENSENHDVAMDMKSHNDVLIEHTITLSNWGFDKVGYGIDPSSNVVIELSTEIIIPTIRKGDTYEILSYNEDAYKFVIDLIFPLCLLYGDILSINHSSGIQQVKIIVILLYQFNLLLHVTTNI